MLRSPQRLIYPLFSILALSFGTAVEAQIAKIQKPKLVVVLVIDQFRADQISRFQERFLPPSQGKGKLGGFRYLLDKGAYFPMAEYGLLQNMTCPGHATILSGAYAYQHGIAINEWTDRKTGQNIYCVEDEASPLVGKNLKAGKKGISPKNFHGSTFGDELKNSGYQSRSVTIALKDRSAVLLGGYRNDLALWFDAGTSSWISSRFYLPDGKLPTWVDELNQNVAKNAKKELSWLLPESEATGRSVATNKHVSAKYVEDMGTDFPHKVKSDSYFALLFPYGTELTTNAAIAALDALKLGNGKDPDLLAVSFSNHDFVAHTFGPNSRELEELTVSEDKEIARLLSHIDQKVGMENTLVVLTADHGGAANPEWLKEHRVDAGRVDESKLLAMAEDFLKKTYGKAKKDNWLWGLSEFNFYLNLNNLEAAKLDRDEVEQKLTQFFRNQIPSLEGIQDAFSGSDVRARTLPPKLWEQEILQTFVRGRSGDVVLIPKANYIVPGATATHLSGYAYDRMVPLILAGPQIKPGVYGQKAAVIDIAPTLSFFTGTTAPSGSEGRVLSEIIGDKK